MEEAAPLLGGSQSLKRRSRWRAAAAAAAATLGVVALARGGRTAPTGAAAAAPPVLYGWQVPTTDNTDLVPPPKARAPGDGPLRQVDDYGRQGSYGRDGRGPVVGL